MPLEDRAKIFSPFDPLQGFREALREVEQQVENDMGETGGAPGVPRLHGTPGAPSIAPYD